jgi:hypothetical protein
MAESRGYTSGFIDDYLVPLVYPPGLNTGTQVLLGTAVLSINIIIYVVIWLRWKYNRLGGEIRLPYFD